MAHPIASQGATALQEVMYTPRQIAEMMQVSLDTVNRKLQGFPGVLDWGSGETFSKRKYSILRIPQSVLDKFLKSIAAGK